MKTLLFAMLIAVSFPVLAVSLHLEDSYALNEFNRNNTFEGSPRVLFSHGGQKFSLGFYTATTVDNPDNSYPFLVLTAWTPEGWFFISKLPPIWYNDLGMDTGSELDDIRNYLWYIGQTFDGPMANYISINGGYDGDIATGGDLMMWEKILNELAGVVVVDDRILFE